MANEYLKGAVLTALGVIILSFDALLIRLIELHSFGLIFWRGLFMTLIIFIWCRYYRPAQQPLVMDAPFWRSGILFAVTTVCFVCAIKLTATANVLVIISAIPLVAAVLSHLLLGEKSPPVTWIAIIICMAGIGWVVKDAWHSDKWLGDLLALICCIGLAGKFVNDRHARSRDMTPALMLAGVLMVVTGALLADPFAVPSTSWLWLALLCGLILPAAYILITIGPMRIPAAEVSMMMLLETALGPLWVWLVIHEAPPAATLQGGSVVIATLLVHSLLRWRKSGRTSPATVNQPEGN